MDREILELKKEITSLKSEVTSLKETVNILQSVATTNRAYTDSKIIELEKKITQI